MKNKFTKYTFFLFISPVLLLIIAYFFGTRTDGEPRTYGINRTINFGGIDIDEILTNPIYNFSIFTLTYLIYLLSYFLIFLNGRFTNFFYFITNFIILLINYFLLFKNSESRILIPLTMIGFIIFTLNIFKTTKKLSAIN